MLTIQLENEAVPAVAGFAEARPKQKAAPFSHNTWLSLRGAFQPLLRRLIESVLPTSGAHYHRSKAIRPSNQATRPNFVGFSELIQHD
jgi:hypothetical protein